MVAIYTNITIIKYWAILFICLFPFSLSASCHKQKVQCILQTNYMNEITDSLIMTGVEKDKPNYVIIPKRMAFKKRSSLFSRIINDFEKSKSYGFRCLVTFLFVNKELKQRTIDPYCFCLIDEDGNVYEEFDTESEDFRSDLLTGPEAVSPQLPIKVKLTFIIPDKSRNYTIKFKGFK